MKKTVISGLLLVLLTLLLAACTLTGNNTTSNTTNTVGLDSQNFVQSSITIKKGTSITLDNQDAIVHIISNGSWQGNVPDSQAEPGAPVVNNLTISSLNQTEVIGPFNTAGTFHYYCLVHSGMDLTVIVQ